MNCKLILHDVAASKYFYTQFRSLAFRHVPQENYLFVCKLNCDIETKLAKLTRELVLFVHQQNDLSKDSKQAEFWLLCRHKIKSREINALECLPSKP